MAYDREYLETVHDNYKKLTQQWEFLVRSYYGGKEYKLGNYLHQYNLELDNEYDLRLDSTPLDNHCRNVVQVYSSFLFRQPPKRDLGNFSKDESVKAFMTDADLDGRDLDTLMKDASTYSMIYGNCWLFVDKPTTNVGTRAEELKQDIRPYVSIVTPENVTNWNYERLPNGKYDLTEVVVREDINKEGTIYRVWKKDLISLCLLPDKGESITLEELPNKLGKIPAVILYNQRSPSRYIGLSSLVDVAELQQSIYNELSEIEQLIRLTNHPSLVKTDSVEASAGAGSVVLLPDDLDPNLKPYQLQPSGASLDSVMNSIKEKVSAIDRISHLGAVRTIRETPTSGIALRTEFNMLNSKLSEQADLLLLAEEQVWDLYADWQDMVFDGDIEYPNNFDIRDYAGDLDFFQKAKLASVNSETFNKEVDKLIAGAVVQDEEVLNEINTQIDEQAVSIGEFEAEKVETPAEEVVEEEE